MNWENEFACGGATLNASRHPQAFGRMTSNNAVSSAEINAELCPVEYIRATD
ncbi:hypothetical protein [Amycolatopsis sp. GM8]|uniref:hypothetical protein n=1 Tax=Amycolatopsis sp. GM8 TaxID=2896530 RepID=UPI001F43D63C|nr:hypothetical protein [Amycolatopsis sp. GM8]